ncbi:hypothetical protein NQ318_000004 [Aromia moschata]|uniref:Uncharacterized protein n=1 Tax=Aromia moschata TaxID=1265417 RepID=A0AAV8X6S0_9CUCU|nr:hypothetical protein NQ318_000004 [Aromia moschata]
MASLSEQRAAVKMCFLLEWVVAKYVPRALTDNQKECRICRALKQQVETDPDFLSKVLLVMSHCAMVTTQKQSKSQANGKAHCHPVQKKCRQVKSNIKTKLICFFQFTQSLFPQVRSSIKPFIWKF